MGRLRWGDDAPAGTEQARVRIIDAAEACLDRLGLAKTTVEDVANQAQVSRATIYRYFGNRDALMLAVLLRELDRSLDSPLDGFLAGVDSPAALGEVLVRSSLHLLDTVRTNPKLRLLLQGDTGGVTATISGASAALFCAYAEEVGPYLRAGQERGLVRSDVAADDLAEWILRVLLSLLTVQGPHPHSADQERALLTAFLVPAIVAG